MATTRFEACAPQILNRVFTEGAGFSDAPVGMSFQDRFDNPSSRVPLGSKAVRYTAVMITARIDHFPQSVDCVSLAQICHAERGSSAFFKEMSRGGVREIVNRVFTEGAGFSDAPVGPRQSE
jgi:hypothetical protein